MECRGIGENLSAYLENHLSSEERAQIEEHLEGCPDCRASLEDLRKTIAFTRDLAELEPPPLLAQEVVEKVRGDAGRKRNFFQRFSAPFSIKAPLEAAAMIVIVVVAVYLYKALQPGVALRDEPAEPVLSQEREQGRERTEQAPPFDQAEPSAPEPLQEAGPAKRAAPVPAKRQASAEKPDGASLGGVPETHDGTADREEMKVKSLPAPEEMSSSVPVERETAPITLYVEEVEKGADELERTLAEFGGVRAEREHIDGGYIVTAEVDHKRITDLHERLRHIGRVVGIGEVRKDREGIGKVKIVILIQPHHRP